MAAWQVFGQC